MRVTSRRFAVAMVLGFAGSAAVSSVGWAQGQGAASPVEQAVAAIVANNANNPAALSAAIQSFLVANPTAEAAQAVLNAAATASPAVQTAIATGFNSAQTALVSAGNTAGAGNLQAARVAAGPAVATALASAPGGSAFAPPPAQTVGGSGGGGTGSTGGVGSSVTRS